MVGEIYLNRTVFLKKGCWGLSRSEQTWGKAHDHRVLRGVPPHVCKHLELKEKERIIC